MKKSIYSLLPMAGTLLAAPVGAVSLPEQLAAEVAVVDAVVQSPQQAANLAALSLLPADAEGYALLTDLKGIQSCLGCKGDTDAIQSVAVAGGKGSTETFSRLALLYKSMLQRSQHEIFCEWAVSTKESEALMGIYDAAERKLMKRVSDYVAQTHVAPGYMVITPVPGKEAELVKLYEAYVKNISEKSEPARIEGFKGAKLSLGNTVLEELKEMGISGMDKRSFYLLTKMQGNAWVIIFCEDPAEVSLPATPEASLLNTPKVKGALAHHSSLLFSMWVDAGLSNAILPMCEMSYSALTQMGASAFKILAEKDAANKSVYDEAAAAAERLSKWKLYTLEGTASMPSETVVWKHGADILVETRGDSFGAECCPGKLLSENLATADDTVYYVETTGGTTPQKYMANFSLEDLMAVVKGVVLSADPMAFEDTLFGNLQTVEQLLPEVHKVLNIGDKLVGMLDTPVMMVVATPDPKTAGKAPVEIPRVAFASAVKNRAGLSEVWSDLQGVVRDIAVKQGVPAEQADLIIATLPIMERTLSPGVKSYMVFQPFVTMMGLEPQLVLTDKAFVLGLQTQYAAQLATSRSGSEGVPFAGTVFSLQFPQLDRTMTSVIHDGEDSWDDVEVVEPASEVNVSEAVADSEMPVVVGSDEDVTCEEDICDRVSPFGGKSPLKVLAEKVSAIYGVATTEKGASVIRIKIKLAPAAAK